MSQYFPPYSTSHLENMKAELGLSNYPTKTDLKNVTQVDTSSFSLKTNLSTLKTEVDKLDIDKLAAAPGDLAKLKDNDVVKKTDFNTLKTKVDSIDTTRYVLKTKYDSEAGDLKLKIPDVSGILQTSTFNSKITEIENKITTVNGKIPDISGLGTKKSISNLATKTEVRNVEDKIPDNNGFVKNVIMQQKLVALRMIMSQMQH